MNFTFKIWLDMDGKVFGQGPLRLLKSIEKTGSLNQGAVEMGISYRKAWNILHAIEEKLGFALIERHTGGAAGGGSKITDEGKKLMEQYEAFCKDAGKELEKLFQKHFPKRKRPEARKRR